MYAVNGTEFRWECPSCGCANHHTVERVFVEFAYCDDEVGGCGDSFVIKYAQEVMDNEV